MGAPGAGIGGSTHGDAQYFLDVDPDGLAAAGQGLAELAEHLRARGSEVSGTPAGISTSVWQGAARTAICAEMSALGGQVSGFAGRFDSAADALAGLASSAREALSQVAGLNRAWQAAQETYAGDLRTLRVKQDQQVAGLDPGMDPTARKLTRQDLADSYAQACSDAGTTREATQRGLDGQFQDVVSGLRVKFRRAGDALAAATVVKVPDSTVSGFVTGGGTGMMPGWCTKDGGVFPPDLHAELALEGSLPLLYRRDVAIDVARVEPYLKAWAKHPGPMDPQIAGILARRCDDPAFAAPIVRALGPQGMIEAIRGAQALSVQDWKQPDAWRHNPDKGAVHQQVMGFQDSSATTLARLLAAATREPAGNDSDHYWSAYATTLVQTDPEVASILFTYADRAHVAFGASFIHQAGTTLVGMERNGDPAVWYNRTTDGGFGSNADPNLFRDPTLAFLHVADNSAESAQAVLGDHALLKYFLTEQPTWFEGRGEATADLLREATINHARDAVAPGTDPHGSTAWRAADIASWAVHDAATSPPLEQTRLALAGIISTYMPDLARGIGTSDSGPGVYDHTHSPWPQGVEGSDGWPAYGIQITQDDARGALAAVGGDEASRKLVAQTATAYTAILIDRGAAAEKGWDAQASHAQGSPFVGAAQTSAQLLGFVVNGLSEGDIADAKDDAERRAKVAGLLMLPTEFVPLDKAGPAAPVAGLVLDQIKESATKGIVGDGVKLAVVQAGQDWDVANQTLELQSLEAARVHGMLCPSDVRNWPKDAAGHLQPVASMTDDQRRAVLQNVGHDQGYTLAARQGVNGARNDFLNPYPNPS